MDLIGADGHRQPLKMTDRKLNAEIRNFYSNKKRKLGIHDEPYGGELDNEFLGEEELRLIKSIEDETDKMLRKWVEKMVPPPDWAEPSGWDSIDAPWRHSVLCTSVDRLRSAVSAEGFVQCECRLIPLVELSPGKEHMDDCVYVDDVKLGREKKDCVCVDMPRGRYYLRDGICSK